MVGNKGSRDKVRNNVKISACLVVWNGEAMIKDCLESIKGCVDEIIVVHDGPCSDNTVKICREYTKKIFIRPHVGEAEPHRPFSFSKATGQWILWIDQDERLPENLQKDLRDLANSAESKDAAAYSFLWPVKYINSNVTKGYFAHERKTVFFRKNAATYGGMPNELVTIKGKILPTDYRLIHLQEGERNTLRAFFKRTRRIVGIHADQLIKKGLVPNCAVFYFFKAFLWFFLYLAYYYVLKRAWKTKADISMSFQLALYNFFLYWYVFKKKMSSRKKMN
jgi:glycosyltransferase involved in cell wall biosynthesis